MEKNFRQHLCGTMRAELGYSSRGLKLALKDYFAELGEKMPDGRSRRGNADDGETANGHHRRDCE